MQIQKNDKGCIRFDNTDGITYDTWTKILNALNHLGYGMPDETSVKEYFNRGIYLQKDQSDEVIRVLSNEQQKIPYTKKKIENDNLKAKEMFGTTEIIDYAGYILTDGDMLNFTYDGYQRDMDHREISHAIHPDSDGYSDGLIQFVTYGNIRVMPNGIELSKRPTQPQIRRIAEFIRHKDSIYVEIANNFGHVVQTFDYTCPISTARIISDVNEYFDLIDA